VHSMTRMANITTRLFENRHGIKIVITQEGELGAFNSVNFMFFIGGAVATLAIASIIVDNIVLRFFIPEEVREIIELASATVVPCRSDLSSYMKAVETHLGGSYAAPVTFWEVEKELLEQQETMGKKAKRPEFKKTAELELQKLVDSARVERMASGAEEKTDTELVAAGALAFARSVSQDPAQEPELHRSMSSVVRERWKLAKTTVYAQVKEQLAREKAGTELSTATTSFLHTTNASTTPPPLASMDNPFAAPTSPSGRRSTVAREPPPLASDNPFVVPAFPPSARTSTAGTERRSTTGSGQQFEQQTGFFGEPKYMGLE